MADEFISLGTVVSASASSPATYDAAGFGALTFSQIVQIESLPAFGVSSDVAEFTPLSTGIKTKRASIKDYGSLDFSCSYSTTDTGAAVLYTEANKAPGLDKQVSVKVVGSNAAIYYFTAQAVKAQNVFGAAGEIAKRDFSLAVDRDVIGPF